MDATTDVHLQLQVWLYLFQVVELAVHHAHMINSLGPRDAVCMAS